MTLSLLKEVNSMHEAIDILRAAQSRVIYIDALWKKLFHAEQYLQGQVQHAIDQAVAEVL